MKHKFNSIFQITVIKREVTTEMMLYISNVVKDKEKSDQRNQLGPTSFWLKGKHFPDTGTWCYSQKRNLNFHQYFVACCYWEGFA